MRNSIFERHGSNAPATCNCNHNRESIDGIWSTPGISITVGGYGALGEGIPSDHRFLWMDISYSSAFGYSTPSTTRPKARKLKARDPRLSDKYNKKFGEFLTTSGLSKRALALKKLSKVSWTQTFVYIYYQNVPDVFGLVHLFRFTLLVSPPFSIIVDLFF
jgi:hypothetical protein